uniref:O-antigen ligase family protein n=1 Tax=Vibrio jasicida TaxID=766224 RepID=UPI0011AFD2F6
FSLTKQFLLVLLILFSIYELAINKVRLNYNVCLFIFSWISIFSVSYLHGLFRGYEASYSLLNYVFLTPVICYLISCTINNERFEFFNKSILFSLYLAVVVSFIYAAHIFGLIKIPDFILSAGFFGGVKISSDVLEMRMSNQSALIFLIPYAMVLISFYTGRERKKILLLVFLSLLIVVLSGRRALQIITIFGALLAYLVYLLSSKDFNRVIVNTFFIACAIIATFFVIFHVISIVSGIEDPIKALFNTLLLAFDSSQKSTTVRSEQVVALINFWNESPLFGHGLNSHPSYLRSDTDKWSYEFVYLAFFSQNGVFLGMVFLSVFLILWRRMWIGFRLQRENSKYFAALLVGSICYFIAAGTNPMIQFYWFWVIFLVPLNNCLYRKEFNL